METKHKKRGSTLTLILLLAVLVALVAAIIYWPVEATAAPIVQDDVAATTIVNVGDTAPDFTVEMLDGTTRTLSELRGKVVLITFWATWCPPCRQEMAHMQEGVIDRFAGQDLVVLPISRGEERKTVENFIKKMDYIFPVGLDTDRAIYDKYASNYVPRSIVVNRDGKVVYVTAGYDQEVAKEINNAITSALR